MINIETRRIVDLLESRELEDVSNWLKEYPNVQVVSRDGSSSYAAAIKVAHPGALQVSDRFHLLKNLTDYAKGIMTRILNAKVEIPITSNSGSISINFPMKRYLMVEKDQFMRRQESNIEKRSKKMEQVRGLREKNYSVRKISEETGLCEATVRRYLKPDYSPVHVNAGTRKESPLSRYHEDIINLLKRCCTYKEIEHEIRRKGYKGSLSAIKMFITRERRQAQTLGQKDSKSGFVERQLLIKLLYKPIEQVNNISKEQVDAVIEKYPDVGRIFEIVRSFKELLFSKKAEQLDKWLERAEALGMEEITSFVNGTKRDIEAVKNAIKYGYNNGLAEGSVNKLKVIKRIMYGRNNFNLLRNKLLLLESRRTFN
jgi:transposase